MLPHEKNTIQFRRFTMGLALSNESCNNLHYHYFALKHKLFSSPLDVEATDYSNFKRKAQICRRPAVCHPFLDKKVSPFSSKSRAPTCCATIVSLSHVKRLIAPLKIVHNAKTAILSQIMCFLIIDSFDLVKNIIANLFSS